MFARLKEALDVFAATVLPTDILPVPEIPAAILANDRQASRKRLEASIIQCAGNKYLYVPVGECPLGPASAKLVASPTGGIADAKEYTDSALNALTLSLHSGHGDHWCE